MQLDEGIGHGGEAERAQAFDGGMNEQVSRSIVVAAATDIRMVQDGRLLRHGSRLVGPVLQDGGDGFVGASVEQEGARAGGVDTFRPVALDEAENPDG